MSDIKAKANHKLFKSFSKFQDVKVGEQTYSVMPAFYDIPKIDYIGYKKNNDIFIITFNNKYHRGSTYTKKVQDIIFKENEKGEIVELCIINLKSLDEKTLKKELNYFISNLSYELKYKDFTKKSINNIWEKKKISFLKEFINNEVVHLLKHKKIINQSN